MKRGNNKLCNNTPIQWVPSYARVITKQKIKMTLLWFNKEWHLSQILNMSIFNEEEKNQISFTITLYCVTRSHNIPSD